MILTHGPSLFSSEHADTVSLTGLALDGGGRTLPAGRALVHFNDVKDVRITDCNVAGAGGNGITLEGCDGEVTHSTITGAADNALFCNDSRGLRIAANSIAKSGNGGIRLWQSDKRADGGLIADNRIEDTAARAGGSGQNGNAINVFRAGNVIVRGNHIRNAAFSAIRGNAASNVQIIGNNCAALDEVAIYCEFGFEGAVIADNVIDGAETGISVTNFNEGGRLATVHGNIVRNLRTEAPPGEARHRHRRRGRYRGQRQCCRGRAPRRHQRRLGPIHAQRRDHRQPGARGRLRRRGIGRGRRRHRGHFRQSVRRHQRRRHCRHGVAQAGLRRSRAFRRRALSATQDQRQSSALTATIRPESVTIYTLMPATRFSRRKLIMLALFAIFLLPLIARAAFYAAGNAPRSWRDADWSSSGLLPSAADYQPARVVVFTGKAGAWKGIFAVHSWIVLKAAGASEWTRYDVVGWGHPVRVNNWPVDGRWYGNTPVAIADISGADAEKLIPRIEAAVEAYRYSHAGDYRIWPGPNSNSFTAAILRAVPELGVALPPNAVGRDYRARLYAGRTDSGTGVELNLAGFAALKLGWVEGIEVDLLGLVAGLDLRHPGVKLPGYGRIGVEFAGRHRARALAFNKQSQSCHGILSRPGISRGDAGAHGVASWLISQGFPCAIRCRCSIRCRSRPSAGASSRRCRSMSAIAATSRASTATSMRDRTATRKCRRRSPTWCSILSRAGRSAPSTSPAARPKLNANFRRLVREARRLGVKVMDRCNLTILSEPSQQDLAEFLAANRVEVVASMPCYLQDNVERQRGKGVFGASIRGLKTLNALGYGSDPALTLNLVYNPQGPALPPPQGSLEADYKRVLGGQYGIVFNKLFVLANMPIQRFGSMLISKGEFDGYLQLLQDAHLDANLDGVMCRRLISVDWRGFVYDCDFNQMLDLPLARGKRARLHLSDLIDDDMTGNPIRVAGHCYGCTAGQGSSCSGALKEAAE